MTARSGIMSRASCLFGRFPALAATLSFALALAGCGALGPSFDEGKQTVRSTVMTTRDYINPNPQIDVNRYSWENPNQEKLALLFSPVDAKVTSLMRYITSQDYRPEAAWMDFLLVRFPWVDGIIVADQDGEILDRRPPVPVKRFSQPLVFESIWRDTLVKTVVDYTALGPEIYLGMPNFSGQDFVGLHVVSFDPRVLFTFCPQPEALFIIDPYARKVWTSGGVPPVGSEEMAALPWEQMLLEKSNGNLTVGENHFTWLARYIGRDRFIYATQSANATVEDKGLKLIPFFGSSK